MHVIDAVTRSGVAVTPATAIVEAAKLMEQRSVSALVIVDHDVPVGFVTDRDLVRRGTALRLGPADPVDRAMSTPPITVEADTDLVDAATLFSVHRIDHLVVTDRGRFAGVVNRRGVAERLAPQQPTAQAS